MKTYGGVDVWIQIFLTSTLDGGERSASWLPDRCLTPRQTGNLINELLKYEENQANQYYTAFNRQHKTYLNHGRGQ
jgi:hypothetical protein